jgi:uncharacterized repeat protein (TIGR03803 family)
MLSRRFNLHALLLLLMLVAGLTAAQAQTFKVIYSFTGGKDGGQPQTGVTIDRAGNLYGTTVYGGVVPFDCNNAPCGGNQCQEAEGCGAVFKLTRSGSTWIVSPLYQFKGTTDGIGPVGKVIIGPDGSLYGTTVQGGVGGCGYLGFTGCGTVYRLQPPATHCKGFLCSWTETQLYRFSGGGDGAEPVSQITFDAAGNIYGAASAGGSTGGGVVYELNAARGWQQNVLYAFTGAPDGAEANSTLTFDHSGNLYGTTFMGGEPGGCNYKRGCGTVFQLVPSGSGWNENILYTFTNGSDGSYPNAGVIIDSSGNLYSSASAGGLGTGGTVFQLVPSNGGWNYNLIQSFYDPYGGPGPWNDLTMDAAGNLYGTTYNGGANDFGTVFKLTPSNGGWLYTDLHDFASDGSDGWYPQGGLVIDSAGNLYGTTAGGGANFVGAVWEITP